MELLCIKVGPPALTMMMVTCFYYGIFATSLTHRFMYVHGNRMHIIRMGRAFRKFPKMKYSV